MQDPFRFCQNFENKCQWKDLKDFIEKQNADKKDIKLIMKFEMTATLQVEIDETVIVSGYYSRI